MGLITTEIRYFFEEEAPELRQIRDALKLSAETERTDRYVIMDESATCGVKIREGRFEIKSLIKKHSSRIGESWEKLSLEMQASPKPKDQISVKKTRWVAYVNSALEKLDPSTQVNCQVEVSEVELAGSRYWSLCLEAGNGDEQNRLNLLEAVFSELRSSFDILSSAYAQSRQKSYPQLLHEILV